MSVSSVSVDDFPYSLSFVPFVKYSHNLQHNDIENPLFIIPGSTSIVRQSGYSDWYEISLKHPKLCSSLELMFESFKNKYNKKNTQMEKNPVCSQFGHWFITRDNKKIIAFTAQTGYNAYDIEADRWLLKKSIFITYTYVIGARSLLINDELVVISDSTKFYFWYLPDDLKKIPLITQKNHGYMKTNKGRYAQHGMCLIDYSCTRGVHDDDDNDIDNDVDNDNDNDDEKSAGTQTDKNKNKEWKIYNLKILIFGGIYAIEFLNSFIQFEFNIYIDEKCDNVDDQNKYDIKSKEKHIDWHDIKCNLKGAEYKQLFSSKYGDFGCECIQIDNEEHVVVMIGGKNATKSKLKSKSKSKMNNINYKRAIVLYHVEKRQLVFIKDVKLINIVL